MSMNSRAIRSPMAVRRAAITPWQGSIGHVAESELGILAVDVELSDDRDGRQPLDALLDILLKRRRQGHGQAVIRAAEQLLAHPDRKVARAVNDRQHPDPRTDRQKIVGRSPLFLHGILPGPGPDRLQLAV